MDKKTENPNMGISYSVIINLVNTYLSFYLPSIHMFSPKKGNKYVDWLLVSLIYSIWVMLSHFVLTFQSVFWVYLLNAGLMWLLYWGFYRDSWKRRLAVLIFCFCLAFASDALAVLFMRAVIPGAVKLYFEAEMGETANLMQLIGNLCFEMAFTVTAAAYLCLRKRKEIRLFLAFLLLPFYQLVLVTGFTVLCNDFTEQVAGTGLAIGIFCSVLDITMLHLLSHILQKQDIEAQMKSLEETRRREYNYFETVTRGMEELRMIRHDFSNQLQAVYKMAEGSGNRDFVREMLEEMEKRIGQQGGI